MATILIEPPSNGLVVGATAVPGATARLTAQGRGEQLCCSGSGGGHCCCGLPCGRASVKMEACHGWQMHSLHYSGGSRHTGGADAAGYPTRRGDDGSSFDAYRLQHLKDEHELQQLVLLSASPRFELSLDKNSCDSCLADRRLVERSRAEAGPNPGPRLHRMDLHPTEINSRPTESKWGRRAGMEAWPARRLGGMEAWRHWVDVEEWLLENVAGCQMCQGARAGWQCGPPPPP